MFEAWRLGTLYSDGSSLTPEDPPVGQLSPREGRWPGNERAPRHVQWGDLGSATSDSKPRAASHGWDPGPAPGLSEPQPLSSSFLSSFHWGGQANPRLLARPLPSTQKLLFGQLLPSLLSPAQVSPLLGRLPHHSSHVPFPRTCPSART